MSHDLLNPLDRERAATMAAMLAAARGPAWCTAIALLAILYGLPGGIAARPVWVEVIAALLMLWQSLLLWRLALDARLFQAFAMSDLLPTNLDQVLSELGLLAVGATTRSMTTRSHGAWRLLRQQALLTVIVLALMLATHVIAKSTGHV